MSSQYDDPTDEIIALYATLIPTAYCGYAALTFVVYDWVVTLPREVRLFWTGKARPLSAILYFSNKYLNLLCLVMGVLVNAPMSDQRCHRVSILGSIFASLSVIPPAVFAGLRAYALTQRHWVSALIFLLSIVQFVTNMVVFRFSSFDISIPIVGCVDYQWIPYFVIQFILPITSRVPSILADVLLIAITWKFIPEGSMKGNSRIDTLKTKGLVWIILYDGMIYFIVLSILNILHLVLTELSVATDGDSSLVSIFTAPLSSVLVSHFLLDLQDAHQRTVVGLATNDPLNTLQSFDIRSVKFAPALGSLVATIDPGADYDFEGSDGYVGEGTDDSFGASKAKTTPPNGDESSRDTRIADEFAVTEVSRGGREEAAVEV